MDVTEETPLFPQLVQHFTPPSEDLRFVAPGATARVSALIVNFNTSGHVQSCLDALGRASVAGGLQVVVVDNASADGSAAAVRARFPDAELIANGENRGYAAANNQAFARATAPYVLLLNPDAAVEPETPEEMARFLEELPEASAVTANLVGADGSSRAYVYDFPSVWTLLLKETALSRLFPSARERTLSAYHMEGRVPLTVAPVPQPPGACLMVRRAALDGMLFDERFPLYFNDVDLCRRLHRWGPIYFLPHVRVRHDPGEGGLKRAPETAMLEYAVSAVRYFRKHHPPLAAAALFLGLGLEFAAKSLHGTLIGILGRPGARAPFRGTPRQNLARLARFLCDLSYFDRRKRARSAGRRLLLRVLEADLWNG